MTPAVYQVAASRTLKFAVDLTPEQIALVGAAVGLAGEAGEVAELIKKGFFHRKGLDERHLREEIGDVCWYVAALCSLAGFDLEDVMRENIAKLQARHPDRQTPVLEAQ